MGLMDIVNSVTQGGGGEHGPVAGGLMQELQSRPGGVSSIFQSFQQNGMGGLVQEWAGGKTTPATPQQVDQGLGGTGMIDSIAGRVGLPPAVVKTGMAVVLPVLIHHFVSNGHATPEGQPTGEHPEMGGLLQSVLSRIA